VLQARQTKCHPRRNKQIFRNRLPIRQPVRQNASSAEKTYSHPRPKSLPRNPFRLLLRRLVPLQSSVQICAPVESKVDAAAVINRSIRKGASFGRELLALAPEVRRHFKETTTTRELPALPWKPWPLIRYRATQWMFNHEQLSAESTLPLRTIEVPWTAQLRLREHRQRLSSRYHSKGHMGKTWNAYET